MKSRGLEALEDIILYLNASEPKGVYCENIKVIKNDLERLEELENDKLLDQAENDDLILKIKALNHNLEEKVEIIFELKNKIQNLEKENQELKKPKFDLSLLDNAKKIEVDYNEKLLKQIQDLEADIDGWKTVAGDYEKHLENYRKENQELKEEKKYYKDKYLDLYNSYQNCEDLKRKKAIGILKPNLSLEFNAEENVYILRINISPFPVGFQITKEQYEIIREVLCDE